MSARKIILILSTVLVFKEFECGLITRFNYDARLYEHFSLKSRFIQYSRTDPEAWKNIPSLLEKRDFAFSSMICTMGPGAWIFYTDPNYQPSDLMIYYLVIGEHCVRSDDVESIQPLGKIDELLEQGVMLFDAPQFGSAQTLITEDSGSGGGGSLIFTGGTAFLVEGGGQKICLSPGAFKEGYCLIPNLKSAFSIDGTVSVKENCTEEEGTDEKKLVMQNCYTDGVHEITSDPDLTIDNLKEVCAGGGDNFLQKKFQLVMDMWTLRLDLKLRSIPVADSPENQIKLSIFWSALQIFKESCKTVDDIYIYLLGHLFAAHLNSNWNSTQISTSTTPEQWATAKGVFEYCAGHLGKVKVFAPTCKSEIKPKPTVNLYIDDGFTEEDGSWLEIIHGDDFDPVIEQIWLIINFVLPTCNLAAGYMNNDWSDLVVLFHENYLDPLQEIWATPGSWRRIYSAVFHGYDMREVHDDIVLCLKAALQASPDYDPIGRPKSFRNVMIYKQDIPDHGSINKTRLNKT